VIISFIAKELGNSGHLSTECVAWYIQSPVDGYKVLGLNERKLVIFRIKERKGGRT
jgi:hypothetical protein